MIPFISFYPPKKGERTGAILYIRGNAIERTGAICKSLEMRWISHIHTTKNI